MSDVSDELDDIRRFAKEHAYSTDENVLRECLDKVNDLESRLVEDAIESRPKTPPVTTSDDPYNALLHVYDPPRCSDTGGPLAEYSIAVKDHIAAAGLPLTAGLSIEPVVPDFDSIIVERLIDAGGTIVGSANMDGLAIGPEGVWSEHDQVRNPTDPERVPGGSSSGSAVAVATGLADVAIGSDAGGSIRKPAAYNELVGIKPTQGVVPTFGKVQTQTTLGAVGPIARSVRDAARVLEVIAGPDRRDPGASNVDIGPLSEGLDGERRYRIGIPEEFYDVADDPVRIAVERVVDEIDDRTDCHIQSVDVDNGIGSMASFVSNPEFRWILDQDGIEHGGHAVADPISQQVIDRIKEVGCNEHITLRKLPGAYVEERTGGASYLAISKRLVEYQQAIDAVFKEIDLLVTPTVPAHPPRTSDDIEHLDRNLSINCQPFNVAGVPAVAVPIGREEGLPVSAQVSAASYEDYMAIRGARMIEQIVEKSTT